AVRLASERSLDRQRRGGGEALVAARAVDRERPEPDAGDATLVGIDARGAFVRQLEDAVEGLRRDLSLLVVDGSRARIGDRRVEAGGLCGLEDVDRAGDVDLRAEHRALADER